MARRARKRSSSVAPPSTALLSILSVYALALPVPALSLEPAPALEWFRTFDGGSFDFANGVAVDAQGNVIVAGASFVLGRPSFNRADMRVIKFDPAGNIAWNVTFDNGGSDSASGAAADSSGNVYVAGGGFTPDFAFFQCRVLKLDPHGRIVWNKRFTRGLPREICFSVAVDTSANVLVGGEVSDTSAVPFNPDAWVFKLNPDGRQLWERVVDSSAGGLVGFDTALRVGTGPDSSVAIAGEERLMFHQGGNVFSIVAENVLLARHDAEGKAVFTRLLDGAKPDTPGMAVDPAGNILVGGAADFFAFWKVSPAGQELVRLVRKRTLPEFGLREFILPTNGGDGDRQGNLYLSGTIASDMAVVKLGPNGEELWGQKLSLPGIGQGQDAAVDQQGNVYVAGFDRGVFPAFNIDMVVAKYPQASSAIRLSVTLDPPSVAPGLATRVKVEARDARGNPVPDLGITLTAEAVPLSGGHDHDVSRPTGTFSGPGIMTASPAHGVTNALGTLTASYRATTFGGEERVLARVSETPAVSTAAALDVRVLDLATTLPSPLRQLPDIGLYVKDGGTCLHHGPEPRLPNGEPAPPECAAPDRNHFGTFAAVSNLQTIALTVSLQGLPQLEVNDMSLPSGGGFDVFGRWTLDVQPPGCRLAGRGHCGHRLGTQADIQVRLGPQARDIDPEGLGGVTRRKLESILKANKSFVRFRHGNHWHLEFPQ